MTSFFHTRKYIYAIIIIAVVVIYQVLVRVSWIRSVDDCTQEYYPTMSGQEAAELYDLPILQAEILPDNVNPVPQIILATYYFEEVAECGLEMKYISTEDTNTVVVSIKIFADDAEISEDWSCVDFEDVLINIPNGHRNHKSACSSVIENNGENIFVRVSSLESVDKTLEIANSIQ